MRSRRGILSLLVTSTALLLFLRSHVHGQDGPSPFDRLDAVVRELIEVRSARNEEENRWREARAHLETTLSFLMQEKAALETQIASVREQEDTADAERERLARRIEEGKRLLLRLDEVVRRGADRLLAVHAALPKPLGRALAAGAVRLRDALRSDVSTANVLERLRLVNAFSADLDRTLGSTHAVKELLEIDGDGRREMDVLYLGAALGYWVGPEDRRAGLVIRTDEGWRIVRRDSLSGEVRKALRIVAKEQAAALVTLPLPAEDER